MKKLLPVFLIIFNLLSVSAQQRNVCIYPYNSDIAEYLNKDFGIDCSYTDESISLESVLSADEKIFEYILKNSKSDFLIVLQTDNLAGFNLYKMWIYDSISGNFEKVFESLTQYDVFPHECTSALVPYLGEPIKHSIEVEVQETVKDRFASMTISSDPQGADLYINEVKVGVTPVYLEEYSIPLSLRLSLDGYSELVTRISEPKEEISFSLVPIDEKDSSNYLSARNKFYESFSNLLFSFGLKAAIPALISGNSSVFSTLNYVSDGLIGVLAGRSVYSLLKYYKGAKQVQP